MNATPRPWKAEDTLVLGPHMELVCDCAPDSDEPLSAKALELARANAQFIAAVANKS